MQDAICSSTRAMAGANISHRDERDGSIMRCGCAFCIQEENALQEMNASASGQERAGNKMMSLIFASFAGLNFLNMPPQSLRSLQLG